MAVVILIALALAGCQSCREIGGGTGLDLPFFDVVFECYPVDGSERVLELCFDGEADELGRALNDEPGGDWTCAPTPRHLGPCVHCCGPDCGRGCNAFNGCFCSEE